MSDRPTDADIDALIRACDVTVPDLVDAIRKAEARVAELSHRACECELTLGEMLDRRAKLDADAERADKAEEAAIILSRKVASLRSALLVIARDSAGLGTCCLDDAMSCVPSGGIRERELANYYSDHVGCDDARCIACHVLGHPEPCAGHGSKAT